MILHYTDKGQGNPVLLLHGMASSSRYWENYLEKLSASHRVIALDLLGFGRSPQSATGYMPETHAQAIATTLKHLEVNEPVIIVAHSMGALIALKFAVLYPKRVKALILIGMPIYLTPKEAQTDITRSKKTLKFTYYGMTSHVLCTTWCYLLRPISKHIAPLYLRKWPKKVAQDSVLHTWRSYSESLANVIEQQDAHEALLKLKMPTTLLYGDQDSQVVLKNAKALHHLPKNIRLEILAGTHNLPLEKQDVLVAHILNS